MTGQHDYPILTPGKLDDVIGHRQRSRRRRCREAILHQLIFRKLFFQKSLRLGVTLAAHPTRPGRDELTSVSQRTIPIELGKALGSSHPTRQQAEKRSNHPHVCSLSRFLRVGWTMYATPILTR